MSITYIAFLYDIIHTEKIIFTQDALRAGERHKKRRNIIKKIRKIILNNEMERGKNI